MQGGFTGDKPVLLPTMSVKELFLQEDLWCVVRLDAHEVRMRFHAPRWWTGAWRQDPSPQNQIIEMFWLCTVSEIHGGMTQDLRT